MKYEIIDSQNKLDGFVKKLAQQRAFVFNTETTGIDPFAIKLLGVSFCFKDGEVYYINNFQFPISDFQKLKEIFENQNIEKYGHDLKYDFEVLHENRVSLAGLAFDTMIAAYLLNPGLGLMTLILLCRRSWVKKLLQLNN